MGLFDFFKKKTSAARPAKPAEPWSSVVQRVTQPEDAARGVNSIPVALRWNGSQLGRQALRDHAARAVQAVDRKYDKDVSDIRIVEINEPQQYVQLVVRMNFSSKDEAMQITSDLKREFGE